MTQRKRAYESAPAFLEAAAQFSAGSPTPETTLARHQLSDGTNTTRRRSQRLSCDQSLSSGQHTPGLSTHDSTARGASTATTNDENHDPKPSGPLALQKDADSAPSSEAVVESSTAAEASREFSEAGHQEAPREASPPTYAKVIDPSSEDPDAITPAPPPDSRVPDTLEPPGEHPVERAETSPLLGDSSTRAISIQEFSHPRHTPPRKRDAIKARLREWRYNVFVHKRMLHRLLKLAGY